MEESDHLLVLVHSTTIGRSTMTAIGMHALLAYQEATALLPSLQSPRTWHYFPILTQSFTEEQSP